MLAEGRQRSAKARKLSAAGREYPAWRDFGGKDDGSSGDEEEAGELPAREEEFLKQIEILHLEETNNRELKKENGYLKEKLAGVERKVKTTQEIKRKIEELQERIEELKKVHHHISQLKKENSELQVENDQLKDDNRIFRFKRTEIR